MRNLDTVVMFLVPILFWAGVVCGVLISTTTSSPHFLGSKRLSRCFVVVAVLFVVNLMHGLARVPFLFGTPALEYPSIAGAAAGLFALISLRDEVRLKSRLKNDERLKQCPQCRSFVDKIFLECPKCKSRLP